jgi:hypothetical protein
MCWLEKQLQCWLVGCELGANGTGIFTRTSDILLSFNRLTNDGL